MSVVEDETHYQNYSVQTTDEASFHEDLESSFDNEERPVYANQSTLNRCKRHKEQEDDSYKSFKEPKGTEEPNRPFFSKGCCGLMRCFCTTFGITVLIGSYIFLGAFLFTAVEGPKEGQELYSLSKGKNETIFALATALRDWNPYDSALKMKLVEYFDIYEKQVLYACNRGFKYNLSHGHKKWTFKGSLFFVISTLTTMGTGVEDMAPQTTWGLVIFFSYTVIGIPLMFIWLVTVGATFAQIILSIYNSLCCDLCCRCCQYEDEVDLQPKENNKNYVNRRLFVPFIIAMLFFLGWIALGIVVLSSWESMSYLQSALFIFSSLSTIGFYRKDLLLLTTNPNEDQTKRYASFLSYLFIGFVLLISCARIMYLMVMRCTCCCKRCNNKR